MTSFVTPLLSFCTEAIKEPPSFHPPLSSKFVGVPDIERALAVLHSKFIQNAYSNRNATQCAPKPWNDRMTEKLGRAYDGSARAKAKRYDQPASSLGTTVSSIVMGALSSASSRSSGNTTVPVSYRTRDSAVPVSTQAPPLPTPRLGRSSFLRSVLSSSNMPTSEQLALATAEALQVTHFQTTHVVLVLLFFGSLTSQINLACFFCEIQLKKTITLFYLRNNFQYSHSHYFYCVPPQLTTDHCSSSSLPALYCFAFASKRSNKSKLHH